MILGEVSRLEDVPYECSAFGAFRHGDMERDIAQLEAGDVVLVKPLRRPHYRADRHRVASFFGLDRWSRKLQTVIPVDKMEPYQKALVDGPFCVAVKLKR